MSGHNECLAKMRGIRIKHAIGHLGNAIQTCLCCSSCFREVFQHFFRTKYAWGEVFLKCVCVFVRVSSVRKWQGKGKPRSANAQTVKPGAGAHNPVKPSEVLQGKRQ